MTYHSERGGINGGAGRKDTGCCFVVYPPGRIDSILQASLKVLASSGPSLAFDHVWSQMVLLLF